MPRHQLNLRMPDAESIQDVKQKAKAAGLPVAEFVRRAIDGRRTASMVDRQMVGELRRLGALLKHRYPKDSNWSLEEKREYWAQMEHINSLAGELEALIRGRQG